MTRDQDAMDVDSPPISEKPTPTTPTPQPPEAAPEQPTATQANGEPPTDSMPSSDAPPAEPAPATFPTEPAASSAGPSSEPAAGPSTSSPSAPPPPPKPSDEPSAQPSAGPSASAADKQKQTEADEEAAANAELLKGVPEPNAEAVLRKERAPGAHLDATSLSVPQLYALVDKALALKAEGNKAFTAKPKPNLEVARDDYIRALDCLPTVPKHLPLPSPEEDRIREVTDEEAEQIELDFLAGPARVRADNAVRDAQKALWGNLGAVYSKQPGKEKETVEACTRALTFDPTYEKALLRRATANERIGTWSSLVAAQNDCAVLMTILPPGADALTTVRKALDVLPAKIGNAKKKETADVVGKMGDL